MQACNTQGTSRMRWFCTGGGTLSCPERLGEKQNIQSWRNDCFYEGDSAMTSSPVSMACTWGRGRHPLPAPSLSLTHSLQFNARGDSWARPSTAHFDVLPAFFLLSLSVSPSDKSSTRVPPPIQVGNYLRTAELPSRRAGTPRELRDAASSAVLLLKGFFPGGTQQSNPVQSPLHKLLATLPPTPRSHPTSM